MCGIYAALTGKLGPVTLTSEAQKVLIRRGPDALAEHLDIARGFHAWQSRLRIHDEIASGDDITETDDYVLLFNGELYNFDELAMRFKLQTDNLTESALIIYLIDTHGLDSLGIMEGMFALILFDKRANRIFFARDFVGIKPLYYRIAAEGIEVGSQIRLFDAKTSTIVGEDSPGYVLPATMGGPLFGFCHVEQVYSCKPGYLYSWAIGEEICELTPIFSLTNLVDEVLKLSNLPSKRLLEEGAHALQEGVRRVFNHGSKFNFKFSSLLLSGGCDSALILSALDGKEIPVWICLDFKNNLSEKQRAENLSAKLHRDVKLARVDDCHWDNIKAEFLEVSDTLSIDGENMFIASKILKQYDRRLTFTGTGGDEIFGAYKTFSKNRLLWNIRKIFPKTFFFAILKRMIGDRAGFAEFVENVTSSSIVGNYFLIRGILRRGETISWNVLCAHSHFVEELRLIASEAEYVKRRLSLNHAFSWLEMRLYLEPILLRDADWTSMHSSIEARVPLLERNTIIAAWAMLMRSNVPRDQLVEHLIGPEFTSKKTIKAGFVPPVIAWRRICDANINSAKDWILYRVARGLNF
jgi:asparagine synthase (glutamine-hydrolysing)